MALEFLIMLVPVGAAAALEAVHRRRRSRFGRFFSARDGFTVGDGRRPHVRLRISADHGVLQASFPPDGWWRVVGGPHPLAERTSLRVLREGEGRLAAWLTEDVVVGSPPFDDNYRIGGSHQDVVRGVMAVPEVRHAVVRVFNQARRRAVLTVEEDRFVVEVATLHGTPEELMGVMLAVKALFVALLVHARAPAVQGETGAGGPLGTQESGVGASSGVPLAVPPAGARHLK